jgi:hypothetical protein
MNFQGQPKGSFEFKAEFPQNCSLSVYSSHQAGIYTRATGAQAQGGILKKSRLKYGMRGKKGCPRERNLREIYTNMLVPQRNRVFSL